MEDQINIMQTREMLEIVNIVVPILNKKERAQLTRFCAKALYRYKKEECMQYFDIRYKKEEYPNGLPMEDASNE